MIVSVGLQMTYHDAKGLLHNINDSGLGFVPSWSSSTLSNMGLHLHQGLQCNRISISILLIGTHNIRLPWIQCSHLPFAWSSLLEHKRTKGCDTLIQVAWLKSILVMNAAVKDFGRHKNLEILVDLKRGICLSRHKHLRAESINVRAN